MNLVRSGALTGFEELARQCGLNPVELIFKAGLSDSQFRNPNSYISYSKMALLLELASEQSGEPCFGLILAGANRPGVLGELPVTVSAEATVASALAELGRHIYLVARGVHLIQVPAGKQVHIQLRFQIESPKGTDQLLQLSVGHLANISADLLGVDRFSLPLYLQQTIVEERSVPYKRCYSGSRFDGIAIPAAWLKRKPVFDEAGVTRQLVERLHNLQATHPESLANQVRVLISQRLAAGESGIGPVAANLDLHPRVLQQKLRAEGICFRDLLRETRQVIAEENLLNSRASITDLALNLGFSDVSVFSRTFKAWTGLSPRVWIRQHRD